MLFIFCATSTLTRTHLASHQPGSTPTNLNQITQDIGRPSYDVGGSVCTNKEKYQTKFFKFEETRAAANTPANYQLTINSSSIPQFKANEVEMYTISKNSVDNYDTEGKLDQESEEFKVLSVSQQALKKCYDDREEYSEDKLKTFHLPE